jgi:hypothetical protein
MPHKRIIVICRSGYIYGEVDDAVFRVAREGLHRGSGMITFSGLVRVRECRTDTYTC